MCLFIPQIPTPFRRRPSPLACRHRAMTLMTTPSNPYYNHNFNNTTNEQSNGSSSAPSSSSPPLEATVRPVPAATVKQDLLNAVSGTNRGFIPSEWQAEQIQALISDLEGTNMSSNTADDTRLFGKWRLLYTDALDVLSLSLLSPVAQVAQINQNIFEVAEQDRKGEKGYDYEIENVVLLEPYFAPVTNSFMGRTVTELKVLAEGRRASDKRIDIMFVRTKLRQQSVVGWQVPEGLPPIGVELGSPVGWIETTYLDDDIRVGRSPPVRGGDKGNVFLLIREH